LQTEHFADVFVFTQTTDVTWWL